MKVFDKKIWNNSEGYGTGSSSQGGVLRIVNNCSNDVEIYYEIDKEEYGNTIVSGGSTQDITITQFGWDTPYYIRYVNGDGEYNSHIFSGTYQETVETNLSLNYYDGNILQPNESKTDTRWVFSEGDGGTLTITAEQGGNRIIINNNGGETLNVYLNGDKDDTLITSISNGSSYTLSDFETAEGMDYKFQFESSVNASASYNGLYQGNLYSGNANCNIDGSNYIWDPTTYDYRWHFNEGDNGGLIISAQSGQQYTLHYALGSYADSHDEDKLPSDVTASEGSTVNIDFSTYPAPASEGYDFVGWSTMDGQNVPDFSEDGTTEITLYSDVTLYPAYAVHIASDYLAINNNYGSSSILVQWYDEDKDSWKTSTEVSAGGYEDFEYHAGREYRLSFSNGTYQPCIFTGNLDGASYVNEACHEYVDGIINAPYDTKWIFTSGVSYLTVQQVTQRTLTYNMGQYADGGSVPSSVTVNDGTMVNIEFSPTPTRTGFRFIGWATSDDAVSADYAQGYTTSVQMFSDIDLYPVFEVVSGNDPQVYFDFTGMGGNDQIDIKVFDHGDWISYQTVSSSTTVTFAAGSSYKFDTTGISSSISEARYNGTYQGAPYTDATVYNTPDMYNPTRNGDTYTFSSGDNATITFEVK